MPPNNDENTRRLIEMLRQITIENNSEYTAEDRDLENQILQAKEFSHLPKDTRRWLSSLTAEEIEGLKDSAALSSKLKKATKAAKIIILAIPITSATIVGFLDNIHWMIGWLKGTHAP